VPSFVHPALPVLIHPIRNTSQVADYAKIVAEEQRRQGAARAEAARARQAEKSRAAEAEAARQLAEAATLVNGGGGGSGDSNGDASGGSQQNALAAAAARQRDAGQSAELESMKAMNEAMLSELEAMALAADDLSNQNVRLLQVRFKERMNERHCN